MIENGNLKEIFHLWKSVLQYWNILMNLRKSIQN